ncbi:hypothetical protein ROHU_035726 [Labeo rohita]|uniref:Uncharacterized protein n=1 Tax=Labeo rohita TaxID=84645 RepID=A0A498LA75_LABRO|nr:hypothetical protein ROHU_035726 [Labeo rohita]
MPSERERRSRHRSQEGRSLLSSAMLGRSRERGTRCRLPSSQTSHRRPPGGGGALSRPPKDVQYHRMAPRVKDAQLVEDRAAVCPGTGPRVFFFFSFPLSFPLASSVLNPRYAAVALTGGGWGGVGGIERSLEGTPRPVRGDGGM